MIHFTDWVNPQLTWDVTGHKHRAPKLSFVKVKNRFLTHPSSFLSALLTASFPAPSPPLPPPFSHLPSLWAQSQLSPVINFYVITVGNLGSWASGQVTPLTGGGGTGLQSTPPVRTSVTKGPFSTCLYTKREVVKQEAADADSPVVSQSQTIHQSLFFSLKGQ